MICPSCKKPLTLVQQWVPVEAGLHVHALTCKHCDAFLGAHPQDSKILAELKKILKELQG
jgi:hypothetical protein